MAERMDHLAVEIQSILLERQVTTFAGLEMTGVHSEPAGCPSRWLFQEISCLEIWCSGEGEEGAVVPWIARWLELPGLRSGLLDPAPIKSLTLRCVPGLGREEEEQLRRVVGNLEILRE